MNRRFGKRKRKIGERFKKPRNPFDDVDTSDPPTGPTNRSYRRRPRK